MSRWIDIADAIKIMACEMYAEAQSQGFDADSVEDFIPEAKAWMSDAPTIDAVEVVWIPCSERMPSEQGEYLVTTSAFDDYSYVNVLSFHKGKFYQTSDEWGDVYDDHVIAWMPIPKPYGERKESE